MNQRYRTPPGVEMLADEAGVWIRNDAMTPAVKMVERALAAWHQAIIAAPETEEVDARRRRCMGAALSAALPLPVEGVDAAIKRLWPNGLGPKNLDELVVFVEEERKCDAEYLANAVKIVQSERATPAAVANALVERIRVYCEYLRIGTKFDGAVRLMNDVSDFIERSALSTLAPSAAPQGGLYGDYTPVSVSASTTLASPSAEAAQPVAIVRHPNFSAGDLKRLAELPPGTALYALSQPQGELREALIAAKRALEIVVPSGEHGRQVKAEALAIIDAALAGRTAG